MTYNIFFNSNKKQSIIEIFVFMDLWLKWELANKTSFIIDFHSLKKKHEIIRWIVKLFKYYLLPFIAIKYLWNIKIFISQMYYRNKFFIQFVVI